VSDIEIQELYDASYRRLLGQLIGVTGSVAFVRGLDPPARLLGADNPEAWPLVHLELALPATRRQSPPAGTQSS
jgi:hypothetical protein